MAKELLTSNFLDSLVPISRFNRGEASKIFEEVAQSGMKLVLKNNAPACVLLAPERYNELLELIEDYALAAEAERRMKKDATCNNRISAADVMNRNGITKDELDAIEDVDIE